MKWIDIKEKPLQEGEEVLAYNKEWIDEDFNPKGVRIGCLDGSGSFISAVWNSTHDCYGTCQEEGDDYDYESVAKDGSSKKFYNKNGKDIEGYRPNMPTHYMYIPKFG